MFENHVRWCRVHTPFISTSSALLRTVHKALRGLEGASIAVIDSRNINHAVYSASDRIQEKKLRISRYYRGTAEYLVWGSIPKNAIAATFKISVLQQIAEQHSDIARLLQLDTIATSRTNRTELWERLSKGPGRINKECGLIIGRLLRLLQIPANVGVEFAISIATGFRFQDGPILSYVEGVNVACGWSLPSPVTHALTFPVNDNNDLAPSEVILFSDSSDNNDDEEENEEEENFLIGMEDEGEQDDDEDDDDIVITTPCPSPRRRQPSDTVIPKSELSPFQLPTPNVSSPVMKFFNSSTGAWSPNQAQGQRNGLYVDVFNPRTRVWSPLAEQLFSSPHPSPGQSREAAIVIDDTDDEEKENYDIVEVVQKTEYDGDDSGTDTVMTDVMPEYVMVDIVPKHRGLKEDRFAEERAHINNIMGFH
ncbi:hypothetical protein Plec18167_001519 [Paecilomyces lecythidis]|uniref:DUF7587 domain-containing protein n=1 Tax=Paecilomyces lecythidis TaxID=3004212 RepID=A0ABR3Y9W0_9EURO